MKLQFFHCDVCGKDIAVLSDSRTPTVCCGKPMRELTPGKTDAAVEKHVPVFTVSGDTVSVRVGSVPHPMEDGHFIAWIGIQTEHGFAFRELHPGDSPEAVFALAPDDRLETVFALCNLHGLWCSDNDDGVIKRFFAKITFRD